MSTINIFNDCPGEWQVWIDTDVESRDGTCIGSGGTRKEALRNAKRELVRQLKVIKRAQSPLSQNRCHMKIQHTPTHEMVVKLRNMQDDGFAEIADRLESLNAVAFGHDLQRSWPVVAFFYTQEDRDQYVKVIEANHPAFKLKKL